MRQNKLIGKYRKYPVEGGVYQIQNFKVLPNDDDYRVTSHSWRLEFHPSTFYKASNVLIDENGFELTNSGEIEQYAYEYFHED